MRSKSYCVNLRPISWQRPARNGRRYYDGQAQDKISFGIILDNQHGGEPLFSNPIHMDIIFHMPIPLAARGRKEGDYHVKTPDIDNLEKFLLDAITGVLITDDRIICSKTAKKVYAMSPRTELVIREVV